jgi:hypothetical protein
MQRPPWIERITRGLNPADLLHGLSHQLSASDLQSLLLQVFRERSVTRTPAELLTQFERSAMVRPAGIDPRALAELERAAFACAGEFEAVELAPVAPLGLNRVLGGIDQNNCLATVRKVEVLADPTTSAALEVACRRRAGVTGSIALCSRSRALRLQPISGPGFFPHFGLFSLVTGARDRGSYQVEVDALRKHLRAYLELLQQQASPREVVLEVSLSDTARDARRLQLADAQVFGPLRLDYPEVTFVIDTSREQGRQYYRGLCLRIDAIWPNAQRWNLADGGFTDWTQRLLSNSKERLLVSAIGIERLLSLRPPLAPIQPTRRVTARD